MGRKGRGDMKSTFKYVYRNVIRYAVARVKKRRRVVIGYHEKYQLKCVFCFPFRVKYIFINFIKKK